MVGTIVIVLATFIVDRTRSYRFVPVIANRVRKMLGASRRHTARLGRKRDS